MKINGKLTKLNNQGMPMSKRVYKKTFVIKSLWYLLNFKFPTT